MRHIRVLHLITGLAIGDQVGGAELFAIQIARHLPKDTFECAVFGLWHYNSPSERTWISTLQREGIQVGLLATPTGHLTTDLKKAFSMLWSMISTFKPDIINSYSERSDVFNILLHLFHPTHPYTVRTMQTDEQWQDRPWVGFIISQVFFPLIYRIELATSKAIRQVLDRRPLAYLINKKSLLCYSGIDMHVFSQKSRTDNSEILKTLGKTFSEHVPLIGIIGRLSPQKGHTILLESIKLVLQKKIVYLLIIGSGPLEFKLKEQCVILNIKEQVHFLGSRSDVLDILPLLQLVVSASLWEGFQTVLLESMALGVPVVATNVSGSRELVQTGVTGLLVPTDDPVSLAEAILKMLNNQAQAQQMAKNARQLATQFTVQNAATYHKKIYQELLG